MMIFSININCNKELIIAPPKVLTASPDEIFTTSVKIGGKVIDNGGDTVTERGVFFGTQPNTQQTGTKITISGNSDVFYKTISELNAGTTYYVNAFATNSAGTSYGKETSFTTQVHFPTVVTSTPTDFTSSTAILGGNVTNDGGFTVSQRGIFWGEVPGVADNGTKVPIGSGSGIFSQVISGLSLGKTYYVRAYATNIKGTSMGEEIYFTLNSVVPTVTTTKASGITTHKAIIAGNVSYDGGASVTERGFYISTNTTPATNGKKIQVGNGVGMFNLALDSLLAKTKYYFVAYATNSVGTSYGDTLSFTTSGNEPIILKYSIKNLTQTSVTLEAIVDPNQLSSNISFEYGLSTSYGNTVDAIENPIASKDTVHVDISGLTMNTVYHFRVKTTNEVGTVYSNDTTFRTVITGITGTVTDIEGNQYNTIGIGYQTWMAQNLRTKTYKTGTKITLITNDSIWTNSATAGYCYYNNDTLTNEDYGLLYNWYVVNTGNVCPDGWHVPTVDDWQQLIDYAGGTSFAGGKLKETGTSHWASPNENATDDYGFKALPGGNRDLNAVFDFMTLEGDWWTATEYSTNHSKFVEILFNYGNIYIANAYKKTGMSIRCVKN